MKQIHKIISHLILFSAVITSYAFKLQMTDDTAQNLVTFFSVVFGFYMTSIAILYNASFTKRLHTQIDNKEQKRGTHILKSYLLIIGYWLILSICLIIFFTTLADKNNEGILNIRLNTFSLPWTHVKIDASLLVTSGLFGIAVLNIFYMLLLMHIIVDGMIEEAKAQYETH